MLLPKAEHFGGGGSAAAFYLERSQAEREFVRRSRHTADLISGSVLRILHGHGHMTAVSELPIVASELVLGTHIPIL